MTGDRHYARAKAERRGRREYPAAIACARKYTARVGQRDGWGQRVPEHLYANAARLLRWALRLDVRSGAV